MNNERDRQWKALRSSRHREGYCALEKIASKLSRVLLFAVLVTTYRQLIEKTLNIAMLQDRCNKMANTANSSNFETSSIQKNIGLAGSAQ